jgi:sporulation-control protein spo0M
MHYPSMCSIYDCLTGRYVVYCFDCARKISTVLEKFVVLNQFTVEQLSSIYDNFILTNPAAVGTNVGSGLVVVSSGSMTSGAMKRVLRDKYPDAPSPRGS